MAAPLPQWLQCRNDIYKLMAMTCFEFRDRAFNVAAVNLVTLPSVETTGSQVDVGYASYIIVPETFDDIDNDEGE